jgi:O-antigen/teichoic acid export membrane protein
VTWRERLAGLARSGAGIAVAMMVMNVATYGFTIVAAHILGPHSYGALIAALNVLLITSVVSLGLQATAARRLAAAPGQVRHIERSILRVTTRTAFVLGGVLLVLTPLLDRVLRLDSPQTAVLIAVSAVPLTMMGGQAGILQGERRWAALGVVYLAAGVPRLLVGAGLILWQPTVFWGLTGVTLGFFAPVVAGWWALRRPRAETSGPSDDDHDVAGLDVLREILHNSQALFAYFALSSVDVIVARNVLSDHDSGLYAAGLILAKAMLFLPQFVVVVAFPSLSTPDERRRALGRSLGVVLVLGAAGTAAAWLLSDLAMVFVGGSEFAEIEPRLWIFALLGTVLSMIQLLVYAVLARQGRRTVWFVWLALAALVGLGLAQSSLLGLVTTVVLVDTALLVVLLFVTAARRGSAASV